MREYTIDPSQGLREAFQVLNPQTDNSDLIAWFRHQDKSEADPRVLNYSLAVLCEHALSKLIEGHHSVSDPELVARVAGALTHYETTIRAFTAVIGHRKFDRLSMLEPVDALKACLPSIVHSPEIISH